MSETTKRIRTEICNIISDMLDNPAECEIYPTTKCYDALEKFIHNEVIRELKNLGDDMDRMGDSYYYEAGGFKDILDGRIADLQLQIKG